MNREGNLIGLIPAAGKATRISPLPMSKELFPIGFHEFDKNSKLRPKVVTHYLLEKFSLAGVHQTFFIIRKGKWDIPEYFGGGEFVNMHLGYLIMQSPLGPPFTLDQAYPFVRNKQIVFGFPDILFEPRDVYVQLINHQHLHNSDIVLGLFKANNPQLTDMVEIDEKGKIQNMFLKPDTTNLHLCWLCGIWKPSFTDFMHEFLLMFEKKLSPQTSEIATGNQKDLTVGAVIKAAIDKGLQVSGVVFPEGRYLDIGTPDDLLKVERFVSENPRF